MNCGTRYSAEVELVCNTFSDWVGVRYGVW